VRRIYTVALFVIMASIDNTVLALLPTMSEVIRADFGVGNQSIGLIIGLNRVVLAVTALFWGYRSDQGDRRRLMIAGTLAWVVPIALIAWARSYEVLMLLMVLAGLGLGCISTVGYSVITDIVAMRWRGTLLGLWGLAQGIGTLGGSLLVGSLLGTYTWRAPFGVMAATGALCSLLALLAVPPQKGGTEAALQPLVEQGVEYEYRIKLSDVPQILTKPSNRWLVLQGFLAQFTFGSLGLLPALITTRLVASGLELSLASGVAALLVVVFQLGGIISIGWGWLGDKLQQRHPQARALLAAYGFWAAVPCYILLFWTPLEPVGAAQGSVIVIVIEQLRSNGWIWVALLAATLAAVFQATNAPNWFAMVSEVNLPEHRGTAFSFITLANNLGAALGVVLVSTTFDLLRSTIQEPLNYVLGLTFFQLFFIPAGLCFWRAARTAPIDAAGVQATLHSRAAQALLPATSEPLSTVGAEG